MRITYSPVPAILLFILWSLGSFAQGPVRVACIGNSVTYGAGLKDPPQESYPVQLQQLLGKSYQVKNFGRSGATLLRKGHNPYYKTKEFSDAIAFKPNIAIVHLGLNDTDPRNWPDYKDEFEADYAWLLDTLRKQNPEVKLYVCRLTPIFSGHSRFKSGTRDWYWQIQERIPRIAKANVAKLVDLNTPLHNRPDLFPDNLHPVKEGAAIIARTVYQSLTGNFEGLKLPELFSDNMVLQRQQPIPVYGTANAGDTITVTFNKITLSATSDGYGQWKVVFPAMQHGGPYQLVVKQKDRQLAVKNILIGDVWLCSGQSNMAFPLKSSLQGKAEINSAAKYPSLRLLKLKPYRATDATVWDSLSLMKANQLDFFSGSWKQSDEITSADFSAIGYYFGRKIQQEENVPVGLIELAVGGSTAESWIDRFAMEHDERMVDILANWRKSDFIQPWARERAELNLKNAGLPTQRHPYQPCFNYEAGIQKLVTSPIKGVIWYQGESNAHNVEMYEQLFPKMVSSWRQQWGYNFPFYYVQLSGIERPSWPSFRYAQYRLQKGIPNSGMAVSYDLGDSLDVHPRKKKQIGDRLALLALRDTYNRPLTASGPEPVMAQQKGKEIVVSFTSAKQLTSSDRGELRGFTLVNTRGEAIRADGEIRGTDVHLAVPEGQNIKTVRYAWEPFTRANLVNEAMLPASTFKLSLK